METLGSGSLVTVDLAHNSLGDEDIAPLLLEYFRRRCSCHVLLDGTAVTSAAAAGLAACRAWAVDGAPLTPAQAPEVLNFVAAAADRFWHISRTATGPCGSKRRKQALAAASHLASQGEALARAFRNSMAAVTADAKAFEEEMASLELRFADLWRQTCNASVGIGAANLGAAYSEVVFSEDHQLTEGVGGSEQAYECGDEEQEQWIMDTLAL